MKRVLYPSAHPVIKRLAGSLPVLRRCATNPNQYLLILISVFTQKENYPLSDKLRIIPLGGLNEIGKNMTVLEYGKDMIVVDCGLGFPEDDMYGVDLVIPDVT